MIKPTSCQQPSKSRPAGGREALAGGQEVMAGDQHQWDAEHATRAVPPGEEPPPHTPRVGNTREAFLLSFQLHPYHSVYATFHSPHPQMPFRKHVLAGGTALLG